MQSAIITEVDKGLKMNRFKLVMSYVRISRRKVAFVLERENQSRMNALYEEVLGNL